MYAPVHDLNDPVVFADFDDRGEPIPVSPEDDEQLQYQLWIEFMEWDAAQRDEAEEEILATEITALAEALALMDVYDAIDMADRMIESGRWDLAIA